MANEKEVAAKIVALKADVARAQQLRATSEASISVAKQRLAEVDEQLKALGLNPENCDVELSALEAQLDKLVAELNAALVTEVTAYNSIVQATKAAFGQ